MKIAIASSINNVKSIIDPHFGRCNWYCIYDTETKKEEFIENTTRNYIRNAGCEAVDILIGKNIKIVIAGRFGSKVVEAFKKKKIQMIVYEKKKTIIEIIKQINNVL